MTSREVMSVTVHAVKRDTPAGIEARTARRCLIDQSQNRALVEKVTLGQRLRQAITGRELQRLIREAPTATVRNDLLMIAVRYERRPGR